MNIPVVTVEKVQKIYGRKNTNQYHALRDISFSIEPGEFVGIMGPSGAGKTTLLNVISTLDHPSEGRIQIAGNEITKMNQQQLADFRAKKLGFVFQDFNLLENLTVYENIALPLSLQSAASKEISVKVAKVAKTLGIEAILPKYPVEISGGEKQRTAAARALVHDPAILLADEPTGALDSKNARGLLEVMTSLNEKHQVSIMIVTHDAISASYCKRILFIRDGSLYKEIHRTSSRQDFYQQILDVLAELGASQEVH